MGHGESANTIFSNLQMLSQFAFDNDTPVKYLLNIGIPDSAYLSRDSGARARRDQVNEMLANRTEVGLHYIPCPLKYCTSSRNYETDGLHFSESGYKEFAIGILNPVYSLLN